MASSTTLNIGPAMPYDALPGPRRAFPTCPSGGPSPGGVGPRPAGRVGHPWSSLGQRPEPSTDWAPLCRLPDEGTPGCFRHTCPLPPFTGMLLAPRAAPTTAPKCTCPCPRDRGEGGGGQGEEGGRGEGEGEGAGGGEGGGAPARVQQPVHPKRLAKHRRRSIGRGRPGASPST